MFFRNYWCRNIVLILAASVVMLSATIIYDLRYTHLGMPYDWREICQSQCVRAAILDSDTLFERQIREFAAAKNLDCTVKYCRTNDQMWFELVTFKVDIIKPDGTPGKYSWTVRENSPALRDTLAVWYDRNVRHISKYDDYFRQYGDSIGWDWKLLAAIGYVESRFRNISCPCGLGVMQLSRGVARRFGAEGAKVRDPQYNIMAAARYIEYMDGRFGDIEDTTERQKFVIAAYNSGMKPVVTARSRARYAKKDDCVWDEVQPYYRKYHSRRYLKMILNKYEEYKDKS